MVIRLRLYIYLIEYKCIFNSYLDSDSIYCTVLSKAVSILPDVYEDDNAHENILKEICLSAGLIDETTEFDEKEREDGSILPILHHIDDSKIEKLPYGRIQQILYTLAELCRSSHRLEREIVFTLIRIASVQQAIHRGYLIGVQVVLRMIIQSLGVSSITSFLDDHIEYIIWRWFNLFKRIDTIPVSLWEASSIRYFYFVNPRYKIQKLYY